MEKVRQNFGTNVDVQSKIDKILGKNQPEQQDE
jgi:hypothetical protein